jgi:hypothetical protein
MVKIKSMNTSMKKNLNHFKQVKLNAGVIAVFKIAEIIVQIVFKSRKKIMKKLLLKLIQEEH